MSIGRSRDLKPAPIAETTAKNRRAITRPLLFYRNGDKNMVKQTSFKTRVKEIAITESKRYKEVFIDHQYLICSKDFHKKDYYILAAEKDNFLHLIGINTNLSAASFFDKCFDGTLIEDDFDFHKKGKDENSIKGSVRRKIKSLKRVSTLFQEDILIEEDFKKNKIVCAIATTDKKITLGFSDGPVSRPKTLLKGNELKTNPLTVDLVLFKKRNEKKFNKIVIGNTELVKEFSDKISHLITKGIK